MTQEQRKKPFNWKIALAAQTACMLEVDAPKVGNVNRFHDFEDASLEDFHRSALAIGRPFGFLEEQGVGKTIFEAVKATREVVSTNTNLGIILLLAPLAMAWCQMISSSGNCCSALWKQHIGEVLDSLSAEDTRYVYKAISLASPSGMGQVKQYDVFQKESPLIPLVEAMKPAAKLDLIARQYTKRF
jgi:triphosphoribosyl-dephospho-CoA synthase